MRLKDLSTVLKKNIISPTYITGSDIFLLTINGFANYDKSYNLQSQAVGEVDNRTLVS